MALVKSTAFGLEKSLGLLSSFSPQTDHDSSPGSDAIPVADQNKDLVGLDNPGTDKEPSQEEDKVFQLSVPVVLEEMMKHETQYTLSCATCQRIVALFRCLDCDATLHCQTCLLHRHRLYPLHRVERWTREFWTSASLLSLGFVYQLGHDGEACIGPSSLQEMVIIDVRGIFCLHFKFCECIDGGEHGAARQLLRNRWYLDAMIDETFICATFAVLDAFNTFNAVCNMTTKDFILSLSRLSPSDGLVSLPDDEFMFLDRCLERMSRQYTALNRLKQSGEYINIAMGHEKSSIDPAIQCWACPRPGMNLPRGWQDVEPDKRWLFTLMLEIDADCDLKSSVTTAEGSKPSLPLGTPYFVNESEEDEEMIGGEDRANTSREDGNITTGMILGVCARHKHVLPRGIAELRGGLTARQIDRVVLSALQDTQLQEVIVSNPVGFSWVEDVRRRSADFYLGLKKDSSTSLTSATPKWQGISTDGCRHASPFDHGKYWVRAETHELLSSIRAAWPELKLSAEIDRQIWIDGRADAYNFQKNLGLGTELLRQLRSAQKMFYQSTVNFKIIDQIVSVENQTAWKQKMEAWTSQATEEDPYFPNFSQGTLNLLEVTIRSLVDRDRETRRITKFLVHGMHLQNLQAILLIELRDGGRNDQIREARQELSRRLKSFRALQSVHMPAFSVIRIDDQERRSPERSVLWMPSECPKTLEKQRHLEAIELQLRRAECQDARWELTMALQTARLMTFLPDEVQKSPDAITILRKVEVYAIKYRRARATIVALGGDASEFEELGDYDFRHYPSNFNPNSFSVNLVETVNRLLSKSPSEEEKNDIEEYVRVEWLRSLIRCNRYREETELVKQEMRRVLDFLQSQAMWWDFYPHAMLVRTTRAEILQHSDGDEGRIAFSLRQAAILRCVAEQFETMWAGIDIPTSSL